MVNLIDTHTHLYIEDFDNDRDLAVIRAKEAGVTRMFMPNIDDTTVERMLTLCDTHEGCFPLIGFHPTSVNENWKSRLAVIEHWLRSGKIFAGIGEIGMDLYWDKTYLKEQQEVFEIQMQWAIEFSLPVVIHCRNAYPEMLEVLFSYKTSGIRGIFHSFSGTQEEAEKLLGFERFMLGINGIVTFKNSILPDFLPSLPLDRIVLETDSPYLSPVPYRGKRNESAYLIKVAEKLSEIYSKPLSEIGRITTENALHVFGECKK